MSDAKRNEIRLEAYVIASKFACDEDELHRIADRIVSSIERNAEVVTVKDVEIDIQDRMAPALKRVDERFWGTTPKTMSVDIGTAAPKAVVYFETLDEMRFPTFVSSHPNGAEFATAWGALNARRVPPSDDRVGYVDVHSDTDPAIIAARQEGWNDLRGLLTRQIDKIKRLNLAERRRSGYALCREASVTTNTAAVDTTRQLERIQCWLNSFTFDAGESVAGDRRREAEIARKFSNRRYRKD